MDSIITERLYLELINKSHIDAVYQIYSSEPVCRYYDISPFTTRDQAEKHINRWLKFYESGHQIRFAIKISEKVIGTCGLYLINSNHKRACLGYDLLPDYWGKGYASEAVDAIIKHTQKLYNLQRIQAEIMPENTSSIKLLENMGFQKEGLLKQYEKWGNKGFVDLLMYAKIFPVVVI